MEQKNMSKVLETFKRALDEFLPYAKSLDNQANILEGKIEHLLNRKAALERENMEQLRKNDLLLASDKARVQTMLDDAQRVLREAQEAYVSAESFRVSAARSNSQNLDSAKKVIEEVSQKAKSLKEKVAA